MDRLGLSVTVLRELNPRLVILSISGFGQDGPEGERAGYDQIVQGEAGLMSLTGSQNSGPTKVGVPIADLLAGIYGAYGTLAALFERTTTGTGRVVRTSLLSSVIGVHAFQGTRWTVAGEVPPLSGDQHPSICPYGLFHCADSDMQLAVGSDQMWRSFAAEFGLAQPEWATNPQRVALRDEVIVAVNAVFGKSSAEEVLARLDRIGIPAGRVRTLDQVYNWEQVRSQGLCLEVEHPTLGRITLPGNPLRFDDNAHSGGRLDHAAPPLLGQHNDSVRSWLDATESESTDQEERSCAM
jgi:formyl-CoA transferase